MGEQAGGNVRFRGPGSLWKTSWKGRQTFSQICCVEGFGSGLAGQFYVNDNGPLDIDPDVGWFLGALVIVQQVPTGTSVIARNGNVVDEGWILTMVDDTVASGEPAVGFNFTVFDGAGIAATVSVGGFLLRNLAEVGGSIAIALLAAIEPVSVGSPNGVAILNGSGVALATPYVNSDPRLLVGRDNLNVFEAPNCISGLVGGTAPWGEGSGVVQVAATLSSWEPLLLEADQVVAVPNVIVPGLLNTNGWRIDPGATPFTPSPNPLPDFVDAEPLVYGNLQPIALDLVVDCTSPFVLYPANLEFPFA